MPRPSRERTFGFRASGIARILQGADANEVLTALLLLGVDPTTQDAFEMLSDAVLGIVARPVVAALTLLDTAIERIQAIEQIARDHITSLPGEDVHWRPILSAGEIARGNVITSKSEITQLQTNFQRRMNEAEITFPQFTWPSSPGIYEEA